MLLAVLLCGLTVEVLGGTSPNADFIEELFGGQSARFSSNIIEDAKHDVPGLVTKYGYPIEIHNVITSDGYILTMHRIPHGRDHNNRPNKNKPVAFVMHGAVSSSADFLVLGPGNALGYILAEAGYDVWLGNGRGNYYSRRHRFLRPNSRLNLDFWKFSWDETGNHDLPAFIDHIIRVTGQPRMHYIAHSQGCANFLVLTTLRPEYNDKFISFHALAPAVFWENNVLYAPIAPFVDLIETTAYTMRIGEVFGNKDFTTWFATRYCMYGSIFHGVCNRVMEKIVSKNLNQTMLPVFLGHTPAGASVRQIVHYGQNIRANAFRRYSYGSITNLVTYGSRTPPDYDLTKATTPTYVYYATNDDSVHPGDVKILVQHLPHVVDVHLVEEPSFDHYDFIWGTRVKQFLYDRLLTKLKNAEEKFS